jgi:exopolyphosphatase/pppGpp-phosphohydrolase
MHNPGLEAARADVIVGGTAILVAIMRYFDRPTCLVSEDDILDGLVQSLLDADADADAVASAGGAGGRGSGA